MSIEQDLNKNNQEEIKTNEVVKETVPVKILSVEEEQAKVEEKKQKEEENNKNIEDVRQEILNKIDGGNQEKNIDPFGKWKEREIQKINDKAKEMEGQTKSGAISDRGPVSAYDRRGALISLDDYGETKFIDFAIKEGSKEDIDYALKLVNTYYRDRDDLKTALMEKK